MGGDDPRVGLDLSGSRSARGQRQDTGSGEPRYAQGVVQRAEEGGRGKSQQGPEHAPPLATGGGNAVDVNRGDYDKRTALHLASGEGHLDVVGRTAARRRPDQGTRTGGRGAPEPRRRARRRGGGRTQAEHQAEHSELGRARRVRPGRRRGPPGRVLRARDDRTDRVRRLRGDIQVPVEGDTRRGQVHQGVEDPAGVAPEERAGDEGQGPDREPGRGHQAGAGGDHRRGEGACAGGLPEGDGDTQADETPEHRHAPGVLPDGRRRGHDIGDMPLLPPRRLQGELHKQCAAPEEDADHIRPAARAGDEPPPQEPPAGDTPRPQAGEPPHRLLGYAQDRRLRSGEDQAESRADVRRGLPDDGRDGVVPVHGARGLPPRGVHRDRRRVLLRDDILLHDPRPPALAGTQRTRRRDEGGARRGEAEGAEERRRATREADVHLLGRGAGGEASVRDDPGDTEGVLPRGLQDGRHGGTGVEEQQGEEVRAGVLRGVVTEGEGRGGREGGTFVWF
ncbi:hypothetical protein THAOC_21210 [Thalassiosira oceanica]|uniref:Uncharacterized protein n=1 Tax=Thalassiosira oceanica TaxID=159749 RepID=K0S1K1_THAOC|nr:hypothetical protein THAOC_21210 [Thalassiosira oceanica]|eukprot:EJK58649.1 hypothetical protein THAOC_21210 [Thalassiosira oceanica]